MVILSIDLLLSIFKRIQNTFTFLIGRATINTCCCKFCWGIINLTRKCKCLSERVSPTSVILHSHILACITSTKEANTYGSDGYQEIHLFHD